MRKLVVGGLVSGLMALGVTAGAPTSAFARPIYAGTTPVRSTLARPPAHAPTVFRRTPVTHNVGRSRLAWSNAVRSTVERMISRRLSVLRPARADGGNGDVCANVGALCTDNWAGEAATGGPFTDVEGTWVQPAVSCPARGAQATFIWAGIDGYNTDTVTSPTVEQSGTAGLCDNGTAIYFAWVEMYPAPAQVLADVVAPGDLIRAETHVTFSGGNHCVPPRLLAANDVPSGLWGRYCQNYTTHVTLSVSDTNVAANTQRWSESVPFTTTAAQLNTAEWIVESPSIPGFCTGTFRSREGYDTCQLAKFNSSLMFLGATASLGGPDQAAQSLAPTSLDMTDAAQTRLRATEAPLSPFWGYPFVTYDSP